MAACNALVLTHLRGQVVLASVEFTDPTKAADEDGYYVDPDDVTFKVKDPAGDVESFADGAPEFEKLAVGRYTLRIDASAAGTWFVRAEGTGDWQAAVEGTFKVAGGEFDV